MEHIRSSRSPSRLENLGEVRANFSLLHELGEPRLKEAFAITSFVFLAIVLPLALSIVVGDGRTHAATGLLALPFSIIVFSAWRLSRGLAETPYNYIRQYLYVYLYVNFGVAAAIQLYFQRYPWSGTYSAGEVLYAYAILAAGIICFEIASPLLRALSATPPMRRLTGRLPPAIFAAVFLIGCAGIVLFFVTRWNEVIFASRQQATETIGGQLGDSALYLLTVRTMYSMPLVAGIIFLLEFSASRGEPLIRRMFLLTGAAGFLGFALALANPISTARFWFATVVLAVVAGIIHCNAPRFFRLIPIALLFAYLTVYPAADAYRSEHDLKIRQQAAFYDLNEIYRGSFLTGDFDSFQQVLNTVQYVDNTGLQSGKQLLGTAFFWVPRKYWPNKPFSSGELVGITAGYNFTNLSCPLWAEGYIDFHLPGTLVFLGLYGIGTLMVQRRAAPMDSLGRLFAGFSLIFAPYSVFLLRGGLMSAIAYIVPTVLAFIFLIGAVKVFERR